MALHACHCINSISAKKTHYHHSEFPVKMIPVVARDSLYIYLYYDYVIGMLVLIHAVVSHVVAVVVIINLSIQIVLLQYSTILICMTTIFIIEVLKED